MLGGEANSDRSSLQENDAACLMQSLLTSLHVQADALAEQVLVGTRYDKTLTDAILKVCQAAKELVALGDRLPTGAETSFSAEDVAAFYRDVDQRIEQRARERTEIRLAEASRRVCDQCGAEMGPAGAA